MSGAESCWHTHPSFNPYGIEIHLPLLREGFYVASLPYLGKALWWSSLSARWGGNVPPSFNFLGNVFIRLVIQVQIITFSSFYYIVAPSGDVLDGADVNILFTPTLGV